MWCGVCAVLDHELVGLSIKEYNSHHTDKKVIQTILYNPTWINAANGCRRCLLLLLLTSLYCASTRAAYSHKSYSILFLFKYYRNLSRFMISIICKVSIGIKFATWFWFQANAARDQPLTLWKRSAPWDNCSSGRFEKSACFRIYNH